MKPCVNMANAAIHLHFITHSKVDPAIVDVLPSSMSISPSTIKDA
jgi:dTDP-4-amino-4,6-dideoxygalactose transaminase